MALNFPTSPTTNDIYTYSDNSWIWNGYAWDSVVASGGTGATGAQGVTGATGAQGVTGPVGDYVISFNGLTGAVGITAGNQISLTQNGNIFSIGVIEGSTSGLDADTLRGVSGQRFLENLQSGLLYGGLISVNAGNTGQVDITAGAGIVVSPGASLTAYPIPVVTPVTWTAKTGVTLSGLTSSDETWLAIDSSGNLVQSANSFTDAQYASQIPLGAALHLSRTYIQLVKTYPHVSYAQPEQFDPFIRAFGNLKLSGHEVTANGANLLVNRSAGKAYALGRNYKNDPNNPNTVTDTSAIPVTIVYHFYRDGSGAFTTTINGQIHPGSLDDGTGTLDTVTPAKYTIQRIFYLPDQPTLLGVYYGRQEYNSISDAQANIPFEEFSESESTATQGIFCGWLIVRGNATALNDTAEAKFVNAGLFRNTANIGGGGLAIASIDDLNDVTTTTPTNNQVLRWNSGTSQWVNSDVSSLAVSSFNGLTGAVTGVASVNGFTGAIVGVGFTSGKLSQFASTTSAELADVISTKTGSGLLVFGTSPTLTTPTLSTNIITTSTGNTITFPNATATIANLTSSQTLTNKTLTLPKILQIAGGADFAQTITVPEASGTIALTQSTVASFNGLTGAVQGVSAAVAGTGISVSGATGSVTITNTGVQSFNGLTGAVTGVTAGGANTFTALNSFSAGLSASGATFSGDIAVNGGDITTTSASATLYNTNCLQVSIGSAASTVNLMGATANTRTGIGSQCYVKTGQTTTTTTAKQLIFSYTNLSGPNADTYFADIIITANYGNFVFGSIGSQITKMLVATSYSNAINHTEYGNVNTGGNLAVYTAEIFGSAVYIYATPTNGFTTVFNVYATLIKGSHGSEEE